MEFSSLNFEPYVTSGFRFPTEKKVKHLLPSHSQSKDPIGREQSWNRFVNLLLVFLLLCFDRRKRFFLLFLPLDEFFYGGGFAGVGTNLSLNGDAQIQNDGILRLTNKTSQLKGYAFYPSPLRFENSTDSVAFSFSTSFAFAIVPEYPNLGGDGFAFTIASTREFKAAYPNQYLGILNPNILGNFSNHVFAVEFDTVKDFGFDDINDNHVGIDINNLHSNASATAAYYTDDSTKHDLYLKSGETIQAWVDYDSVNHLLNVTLSPTSLKPSRSLLSLHLDLSPILHETMYVGFSASTGLLCSSHYIFGWNFKMKGEAPPLELSSLPLLPGRKKKHTAFTIGVSASAAVHMIAAISVAVYLIWKVRNTYVAEEWEFSVGPHRFSYNELKIATNGFRDKELLGFGGFGRVYKGTLQNSKTQIAVKRISHESRQGLREFISEIASIGRLRHRNLVQLQG
uniref:non-specific serine/threonine protein kinase n=1 Tax=Nelumbo nucifera TaxID=4432 RepID=A0A822Y596_NELNU|nr:TPA_asm: hypothetical protein HUJ06_027967 [Nelumbo nucifera]